MIDGRPALHLLHEFADARQTAFARQRKQAAFDQILLVCGQVETGMILQELTQILIVWRGHGGLSRASRKDFKPRLGSGELDQADFLELRGDDVLVERLHDVFVGAAVERARDMIDAVFGGAEHHLGLIAAGHAAQMAEELVAVHHRHVPVEQNGLGHRALADDQRLHAVFGFDDLEIQSLPGCGARFYERCWNHRQRDMFSFPASFLDERRMPTGYAARAVFGTISRTRSTSRTTMSWPSRRWTPPASLAMRGSRLTGFSSRPSSGSLSTSPIWSISRP